MAYKGILRGNHIELSEPLPFPEGTQVDVMVEATGQSRPRKGSPNAVLRLVGTLTHEEAKLIRQAVGEIRRVDPELWEESDR